MPQKKKVKTKKREKKSVPEGKACIKATFNNTIVTLTDPNGNVLAWSSSGAVGFKGSRKGTPYAAQMAASTAARKAAEYGGGSRQGSRKRPRGCHPRPAKLRAVHHQYQGCNAHSA